MPTTYKTAPAWQPHQEGGHPLAEFLNTLEYGVDVANLSILFQGKFEDRFTDNYFVTVIEFRLYYPVFIYKCTVGAIHVEDMIDAINILNLAVR